jgi:gentisate 1,2-dioxygenase
MKQLVGRWEIGGLREIWCAELQKGFWCESDQFPLKRSMYYVTEGEVRFTIYDTEFIAKAEHVVDIPKFAHYRAEALSDAVVYDVGGLPLWEAFLEDRESILTRAPERWPLEAKQIREKFIIPITSIGLQ